MACGARGIDHRRGRLHHRHDRLPRGAHRPVVLRADRHDDRARRSATPASTPKTPRAIDGMPQVAGFIVRDASPSHRTGAPSETLDAYLAQHGIVGITGIDTRALTRHLRDHGSQNGAIGTESRRGACSQGARSRPRWTGSTSSKRVTPKEPYAFTEGRRARGAPEPRRAPDQARTWSRSTSASSTTSCAASSTRAASVTVVPGEHQAPPTSWRSTPTACSSRTARAIPPRSTYAVETIKRAARQEAALRHLPRAPAPRARARRQRPTSSSSATAASNQPVQGSRRPAASRSPPRTTASASTSASLEGKRRDARTCT